MASPVASHISAVTILSAILVYTWRYGGCAGNSIVSFDLLPVGHETKLTLIHLGLETFPDSNLHLAKENFATGWMHIIGSSLKEHFEKEVD